MEIPTAINLRIGEAYTLNLQGLGTAGYVWIYELLENSDVVDVLEMTAENLQSDIEESSTSVGSSRDEVYIIRALKSGHSAIRFIQNRPWERNQMPLKEYIFEINVQD